VQLVNVSNGDMLSRDGQAVALVHREDAGWYPGKCDASTGLWRISGDGILYAITSRRRAKGATSVNIRPNVRNSAMQADPGICSLRECHYQVGRLLSWIPKRKIRRDELREYSKIKDQRG